MKNKKLILGIIFSAFLIIPFVSALEVECTQGGGQCKSNEFCFNYECRKTETGGALEDVEQGNDLGIESDKNSQNNSVNSALIIALGIIIGLIILGLLIKKRNRENGK